MYEKGTQVDQFLIAGFQYHEGAEVLRKLKVGTKLDLVPEFDNPYDPNAIRIEYKGTHLGYVPRANNALLAQMLYYGHDDIVRCRVTQRDAKATPRDQVRVKLYLRDARKKAKKGKTSK